MERKGIPDKGSKEVALNGRVYWTRVREKWAWNGRVSLDKGSKEVGGEGKGIIGQGVEGSGWGREGYHWTRGRRKWVGKGRKLHLN